MSNGSVIADRVAAPSRPMSFRAEELRDGPGATSDDGPCPVPRGLAPGARVDRYEIEGIISSGSVDVVYRARDPELHRDIAIKILHAISANSPLSPAEAQARLLREARVLARLSHPNVVAVYDVGTVEDGVFFAMELIEGVSLHDWLLRAHGRGEILQVLISAGRGLVAAHAKGVLHRDFKPDNVMISADGRVRVVNFGLARADAFSAAEALEGGKAGPIASDRALASASGPIVRPGATGTPGYISPEQLRGEEVDHRSDQFSFAVTAFIALTGLEPFPKAAARDAAPARGTRAPWPRSVPRKLRRIIDRGLASRAEDRHSSLARMVEALERVATPPRRRAIVMALAGALVVGTATLVVVARNEANTALCNVGDSAFVGVWDAARRSAVEQAFRATARNNAGEAFELVSRRLDTFERQWLELRRESCEATHLRGEQPERVMALRARCLDRALQGTKALVDTFTRVDATTFDAAAGASPASLGDCSDKLAFLGTADALPADSGVRARIEDVEIGLAVNSALVSAGRASEAVEAAKHFLNLARATEYPPTIAAATAQLGVATYRAGLTKEQRSAGEALLKESIVLAATARDDALLARTSSFVFFIVSYTQMRTAEAEAMLPAVEALVSRGGNRPEQRMQLMLGEATILDQRGKLPETVETLKKAIVFSESFVDDELQRYGALAASALGDVYTALGQSEDAVAAQRSALEGLRRTYGDGHPRLVAGLINFALVQAKAGQREPAFATLEELRRLAATLPANEPSLKNIPFAEGRVWRAVGDCARAVPFFRRALAEYSIVNGPTHPVTTKVLGHLGLCLAETGHVPEAIQHLEQALANRRSSNDAAIADAALNLAEVLWLVPAERERALSLAKEAKAIWQSDGAPGLARQADAWLAAHRLGR
jgi:tetratricopeptide (TPR) repeat protein